MRKKMNIEVYHNKCKNESLSEKSRNIRIEEFRQTSKRFIETNFFPENMLSYFIKTVTKINNRLQGKRNICFFDIGTAEGVYAISVMQKTKKANIVCFEPEEPRKVVLLENINKCYEKLPDSTDDTEYNIDIYENIVSDGANSTEKLRHYECLSSGGGAGSSTIVKVDRPNRKSIDVEYDALKLDDFVDKFDYVDLVKIDVEGAECKVIKGASSFIEKFKPCIFLEVHTGANYGSVSIEDIKKIIKSDYVYTLIDSHVGLEYYLLTPKKKDE